MSTKKLGIEKLYESDDFLIVNKPYDMYINSDDEKETNTVTYHVASPDSHLSTSADPIHFIQRLDYATSGVLCIAKNKSAAARGGKLFETRRARKYYLAIVRGHVDFELADIEYDIVEKMLSANELVGCQRLGGFPYPIVTPLGIDPTAVHSTHAMCAHTGAQASFTHCGAVSRRAHTRVLALERGQYNNAPATVLLLKPITGRRHQLRVHCSAVGHVVLGDCTYSRAADTEPHRMFLHATRLVLPFSQETIDVQTEEPFFSHPQFTSKWKSDKCFYKYRSKEDFRHVCDIIDKSYVIGVKYNMFRYVKSL